MTSADPKRTPPPKQDEDATDEPNVETQEAIDTPSPNPAGIVSHQDRFSEPDSVDETLVDRLFARPAADPVPEAKIVPPRSPEPTGVHRYGTLFFSRVHKITSGLYGGVEISGIDVFNREVKLLAREIVPTFVDEVRVSELSEIPLSVLAKDLFDVNIDEFRINETEYDLKAWYRFLNESILPVVEELTESWLGPAGQNIPNPIADLFHGPDGILSEMLHPKAVMLKVQNLKDSRIVPIR